MILRSKNNNNSTEKMNQEKLKFEKENEDISI